MSLVLKMKISTRGDASSATVLKVFEEFARHKHWITKYPDLYSSVHMIDKGGSSLPDV